MDAGMLQLFVREVDRQARFGLRAAAELRHAVVSSDMECVWYSVQGLLVATGNVSKLLWPSRGGSPERGDVLRRVLRVGDDSPLASRTFRNHFEHFDERLEAWGISPRTHMVADDNVGPLGAISGGASPVFVRNYDPSTETLTFRGEVYELRPVIDALENLRAATERELG